MKYTLFEETKAVKNCRGFGRLNFKDSHDLDCHLQQSSSAEQAIWLGVTNPRVKIMYKDARDTGFLTKFKLQKDAPETNDYGWCTIPLPDCVLIESVMHLTKDQAYELGKKLIEWSKKDEL